MIKFFGGKDQYESYTNAKKEAAKLSQSFNASLKIINADEVQSLEDFIQDLEGIGMFSENSVFFIKRLGQNKKVESYFNENYSRLKSLEVILWEDSNPDGRSKLTQTLKKEGVLFLYDEAKEKDLKKWVQAVLQKAEINLKSSDIDLLIQALGFDKFAILNELKKIKLYLENKKTKSITTEELNEIMGFNIKGNIWKFLDYLGERKKRECFNEYLKLTAFEDNTQYLISMIERELSIISQIKFIESNNLDFRSLKLHPFVLQKSQNKAKNFKWFEVKQFLGKLLNLDFAIKRGDIDEKLGLSLYLLSF